MVSGAEAHTRIAKRFSVHRWQRQHGLSDAWHRLDLLAMSTLFRHPLMMSKGSSDSIRGQSHLRRCDLARPITGRSTDEELIYKIANTFST